MISPRMAIGVAVGWCAVLVLVLFLLTKEYQPMTDRMSRALRTFWQASIPSALAIVSAKVADVQGLSDLNGFVSVVGPPLIGAAASGLSAAWYSLFPPATPPAA